MVKLNRETKTNSIKVTYISKLVEVKYVETEPIEEIAKRVVAFLKIKLDMQPLLVTRNQDCSVNQKLSDTRELQNNITYYLVFDPAKSGGILVTQTQGCSKIKRDLSMPMICPFVTCARHFKESGNLKTHSRTHTGERPFVCQEEGCNKEFITRGHLITHKMIHTKELPFKCNQCDKAYARSGRLKIHHRTHLGIKPFQCDICQKNFTERGNLKIHQRIHLGIKPYLCQKCGVSFTTHGHLSDHERSHTGERPFACNVCNQTFIRSSTLKSHSKKHNNDFTNHKKKRNMKDESKYRKVHRSQEMTLGQQSSAPQYQQPVLKKLDLSNIPEKSQIENRQRAFSPMVIHSTIPHPKTNGFSMLALKPLQKSPIMTPSVNFRLPTMQDILPKSPNLIFLNQAQDQSPVLRLPNWNVLTPRYNLFHQLNKSPQTVWPSAIQSSMTPHNDINRTALMPSVTFSHNQEKSTSHFVQLAAGNVTFAQLCEFVQDGVQQQDTVQGSHHDY